MLTYQWPFPTVGINHDDVYAAPMVSVIIFDFFDLKSTFRLVIRKRGPN